MIDHYQDVVLLEKNDEGRRSAEAYARVIHARDVEHNPLYAPEPTQTFCNIFVWHVMTAMGVVLPHWVDAGGKPQPAYAHGAHELNANALQTWLENHGAEYGWQRLDAALPQSLYGLAQSKANDGFPILAIWRNPTGPTGHIAVVRPADPGQPIPRIAQAGREVFENTHLRAGFGARPVQFWWHL